MLKYLFTNIVFSEIPEEVTLAVSITGCQIRCKGCHSRELWEEKGTILDIPELERLLEANKGVSCLLLLGGEHDMDTLTMLFQYACKRIRTAWYSGLDILPTERACILEFVDYIKLGHYDMELGGLDSPTTNQRLYKKCQHSGSEAWMDITGKLQHTKEDNDKS